MAHDFCLRVPELLVVTTPKDIAHSGSSASGATPSPSRFVSFQV